MKKQTVKELIKEEENLYENIMKLLKGKQTSTVKSVLDRLSEGLINISIIQ